MLFLNACFEIGWLFRKKFICSGKQNSFQEMGFMPYRASLGLFCHLLNSITSGIGISGRDPLPFLPQGGVVDSRAILIMEFSIT